VLVKDASIYDFDTALKPYFLKVPVNKPVKFKIQQYTILKYTTTGRVLASKTYTSCFTPFRFRTGFEHELEVHKAPATKLKKGKISDIKHLYPYIKEESRKFYDEFFAKQ
jgi:hypothetical protein